MILNKLEKEVHDRYDLIAKAFVNTNRLSKKDFIAVAFETVFSLIPEAEKGSYYEIEGDYFEPILAYGYDIDLLKKLKFHKDKHFTDYFSPTKADIDVYEVHFKQRSIQKLDAMTIDTLDKLDTLDNLSTLFAPIKIGEEKIAVICLDNLENNNFTKESRTILKIYSQMISNFYTMKLSQEKLENRYQDIISALVTAIEVKDLYTKGHASRVSDISISIAVAYGLSAGSISDLKTGALLHDVGKIGIDTSILCKPGALTDDEYNKIKEHPLDAKKILEKIEGFEKITLMAYSHHEHYNGQGYPQGLRGDHILIEAHIIQLADAFDAMTSERSYRKALTTSHALKIIQSEKGHQFHPELVDILLALYGRKIA